MLFPGSPPWNLIFKGRFEWEDNDQEHEVTSDMEDSEDKRTKHQRLMWEHMKIESARKKLESVWKKYGLHTMNPGVKEFKMSATHYAELKEAFDRYMKLDHDSRGVPYNPNGTIVFNGPNGPVKIVAR